MPAAIGLAAGPCRRSRLFWAYSLPVELYPLWHSDRAIDAGLGMGQMLGMF